MALGERLWQELVRAGGTWWSRLQGVNQQLLTSYGVPLPELQLVCDKSLDPNGYRFRLAGASWEQGLLYPGRWFATGDADAVSLLMGEWAQEPIYGLEGRWILESRAEGARALGCHLLGPEALWVGHICDRLENRLACCLSASWLQRRLDQLQLKSPGPGFAQPLRWLLEERISIAPLADILEAYTSVSRDATKRLRAIRRALGARLVAPWLNQEGQLVSLTLSALTAKKLRRELARANGADAWFLGLLVHQLQSELDWAFHHHGEAALVVAGDLRRDLFELLPFEMRRTPVLAFDEIPPDVELVSASVVGSRVHPLVREWPNTHWGQDGTLLFLDE